MDENPRVSVLMPVYNGERYLAEAVESILDQTFTDFEFIIVDDGSTDGTAACLDAFRDRRIVRLTNQANIGLIRSLNKGLKLARAEYVARMDADDVSLPRRLEAQVEFMDAHREVGVVGCSIRRIDSSGFTIREVCHPTTHGLILWHLCFYTPIAHPTAVYRRAIIERVGGYDVSFAHAEDRDLWQRVSSVARLANLRQTHLLYRVHSTSVSHRHADIQRRNSARVAQRMMGEFLGWRVPFDVCYNIRRWQFETADDAVQAARVVRSLYDAFVAKQDLSVPERRAIRRNAAYRLLNLAWHWKREARMRDFFAAALRLDPLVPAKALRAKAKRRAVNAVRKSRLALRRAGRRRNERARPMGRESAGTSDCTGS